MSDPAAKCDHCSCRGEPFPCIARTEHGSVLHCRKLDPADPWYDPRFAAGIREKSRALAEGRDPRPRTVAAPGPLRVAVVIPCHDYGRYLGEAIDSALAQTVRPAEILIVDDASSDDTPEVAARYIRPGVVYLRIDARNVHLARMVGAEATTAEVLCFLDADDVFAPDYLERALPLLADRRVGVVYSDVEYFGDRGGRSQYPEFDLARLERENYVHAGSLVRRAALEQSDAFAGTPRVQAYADWFLWRRVIDGGWHAAKQPALYRYRQHGESMTATRGAVASYFDRAALDLQAVTILTPLSGRRAAWPLYAGWLESQTWPRDRCRLVLLDTSGDPEFGATVRAWLAGCDYPSTTYLSRTFAEPGLADRPRREHVEAVRAAMRRIYGTLAAEVRTPFALTVEDDVFPPTGVIEGLLRAMDERTGAVVAPYASRFHPGPVAWDASGTPLRPSYGVVEAGGSGFGCTLFRRGILAGETFAPGPGEPADYDIAFSGRVRSAGLAWKVDWDHPAEHLGAAPLDVPRPLSPAEYARLREAENCPHLCGSCRTKRCGETGRHPGRPVDAPFCLECVTAAGM
jgi:GT2 family glycosyltransferase